MSNKGYMKEMSADDTSKRLPAFTELAGKDDRAVIAQLFSFVEKLVEENRFLKERIEVLEEEVKVLRSQLNKDSHNSDKPPSSDKFKEITKSLRKPSGNPTGGQKGHEGHTLPMIENPDDIVPHCVKVCSGCRNSLEETPVKYYVIGQVLEPVTIMITREHRAEVKECLFCGKENRAELPEGVVAGVQYGPRGKALMTYFNQYQEIPSERTCEIFYHLFAHGISEGTLHNALRKCYVSLRGYEENVKHFIIKSPVASFDESGISCKGKSHWLHVASTPKLTHYASHQKRGGDAMDSIGILPHFNGRAVHDGLNAYEKYPCSHSLCNAHHLRALTYIYEEDKEQWAVEMKNLLLEIKESVDNAKISLPSLAPRILRDYESRYDKIIEKGLQHHPIADTTNIGPKKRGRKKQSKGKNLLDRLKEHKSEALGFMYDFRIPFDNNLAERDIRMVKLKMKISGTFRSTEGSDIFSRIRGYISTAKKNGQNIIEALENAFLGKPFLPENR